MRASVSKMMLEASKLVVTAPSKSEPNATWSTPSKSLVYLMAAAMEAGWIDPTASSQNPIPIRPPFLAMAAKWHRKDSEGYRRFH